MTTFALIAHYQFYENYAIDAEGNIGEGEKAYWKPKGGHEVTIASDITVAEAAATSPSHWEALIAEHGPESDTMAKYSLTDWELVELNEALIERVREFIKNNYDHDKSFVEWQWCHKAGSEHEFRWAVEQMAA